jgi:hypothetical protein
MTVREQYHQFQIAVHEQCSNEIFKTNPVSFHPVLLICYQIAVSLMLELHSIIAPFLPGNIFWMGLVGKQVLQQLTANRGAHLVSGGLETATKGLWGNWNKTILFVTQTATTK